MAFTQRGKRQAYDNIAVGSAAGHELTNAETVSVVKVYGGGTRTSTSTGDVDHTNVAVGVTVSEQAGAAVVGGEIPERLGDGVTHTIEIVG